MILYLPPYPFELLHKGLSFTGVAEGAESNSTLLSVAHAASCHATKAANDEDDWVFANPRTGKPFNTIYNSWNSARIKAGLADVRIHDLRHNFASQLVNAGRSLYEVQKILGHADAITTQRYAHLSQERLKEAANSVQLPEVPCMDLQQRKTPAANDASIGIEKLLEIIASEKDWTAEEVLQLKALLAASA
ncbi:MAG: site-specific integrase [Marinospirillum sp.]|uniref:tyrosine-type recombinase/integrase n=1 Tax=Marinospirillum sp. TaxID=2183934 RepID=UPI0019E89DC7|nr:site-specific integrase [Marinospirillum sp.]MBE0505841.1 site-specific integrase [Marinospirillum sp.]